MAPSEPAGIDLRHYAQVVRKYIIVIVAATLVLGGAAYFYAHSKVPMYAATAALLYEPQLDVTNAGSSTGQSDAYTQSLELDSAATVIAGPDIRDLVKEQIGNPQSWPYYYVSATPGTPLDSSSSSSTLNVEVDSTDPSWAAKLATAYARQFVAWRIDNQRQRIAAAVAVIEEKRKEFKTALQQQSTDYYYLTQRLNDLEIQSQTATGNFRLVSPASTPGAPFAPQPKRSAAIGAFIGLVLGLSFAFVRDKLDTSLRSHHEVRDVSGMPVVGRIARIPDDVLAKNPLVVANNGDGRAAESLRVLRSNLDFVCLGEEYRRLMVVSAQKGEGKSLLTANLAASMSLAGKRVVLVDADLRRPKVHRMFNLPNNVGVSSIVAGRVPLEKALLTYNVLPKVRRNGNSADPTGDFDPTPSLKILTAGPVPPNPGEMVASQRFTAILDQLSAMPFDYILIDSPAFMAVGDVAALAAHVDGIFLLVNMKMTSRPILEESREFLAPLPPRKLGVVTVMDHIGDERHRYYAGTY